MCWNNGLDFGSATNLSYCMRDLSKAITFVSEIWWFEIIITEMRQNFRLYHDSIPYTYDTI